MGHSTQFSSEVQEFLAWKATHAKRASINYEIWLNRLVASSKRSKLADLTLQDLIHFQKTLEGKYSPYSVQFALIAIKGLLKFHRMIGKTCISPEFIRLPRIMPKSHKAVSNKEYQAIIEVIAPTFIGIRDLVMLRMLYDTGMRISELCGLNVSDIDPEKTFTTIQTKKNNNSRIVVWSEDTHKALLFYLQGRNRLTSHPALFVNLWHERLTTRGVERNLKGYCLKAGIQSKITPHSFRHGWAHRRRDENAPLAFIQRGLGHTSPVSTFIYEQYNDPDFLKQAKTYLRKS